MDLEGIFAYMFSIERRCRRGWDYLSGDWNIEGAPRGAKELVGAARRRGWSKHQFV